MLPTFVIGLREGVEASLIVGIVAALVRQRGALRQLKFVWLGVGLGVAVLVIVGFSVRVRDDAAEGGVRAVSLIEVEGRSTDEVIRQLRGFPEIEALYTTNGAWDLVAEVRTPDLAGFDRLLGRIRSVPGVLNSETSLLLSSVLR